MSAESVHESLRRSPLFRHLEEASLNYLAENTRRQTLSAQEILFHQGDPAEHFFLLEKGVIKLARISSDGQEKVVHLVRPHETFAEAVMFMNARRYPVTAEPLEDTVLLVIPSREYREILVESPEACMQLLADLSRRLHTRLEDIDQLTLQQSRPRVVRYLLAQTRARGEPGERIQLPAPKHVVASRLSMTPETLSRILHERVGNGLIEVHQREIILLDPDELRALS